MVMCKPEWSVVLGDRKQELEAAEIEQSLFTKRVCPDLDVIPKDKWQLRGKYEHSNRISFSTIIEDCEEGPDCKKGDERDKFLNAIYFTENVLKSAVFLYNKDEPDDNIILRPQNVQLQ